MLEKLKSKNKNISELLEHIMAVIVFIAILVAIFSLWEPFKEFLQNRNDAHAFHNFLGSTFFIVIGIEFFKLLCNPSKHSLVEVLMFVIARHMIIEETSAMENLLSIAAIALLFFVDRFLLTESSTPTNPVPDDDSSGNNGPLE